ncbi:MAG: 2-C-methyl-D-erythritol 4-phosphate cytidylyltransferase [Pseudoflavonifractor sp.]
MGFLEKLRRTKRADLPYCAAVVPAAGSSVRMEGQDKLLLTLGDDPVLVHTLRALESSACIREIVVVTRQDLIVPVARLCGDYGLDKVSKVVAGGASRTESVLAGVREVSERAELIAIHDGARPLVTAEVIYGAVLRAAECGAAAPAVPMKDTVKQAEKGFVTATPDRETLFAVQTPQVFEAALIYGALQKSVTDGAVLTDDCSAVERLGMSVALTKGSYENIKITTSVDLLMAEAILQGRDDQ